MIKAPLRWRREVGGRPVSIAWGGGTKGEAGGDREHIYIYSGYDL
ncbi:MAG TPA: hypothetical protein VKK79_14550 [Candidatus Lokiarchaeia archaeon]|nr:hypothetical protein [Candidatus Lokiarchaeia archaeon]